MDLNLKGKVAVVTAASKGIGKSIAEGLLNEGVKVLISSSNRENLRQLDAEFSEKGFTGYSLEVCDLNLKSDIERLFAKAILEFDIVDILINNCGGPKAGAPSSMNDSDWQKGYEHTLLSAVRLTSLAVEEMKKNKWGRIINITSLSVKQPIDNLTLSNAFRSALTAYAKTLSLEVGQYNITVNNIMPGYTLTERLDHLAAIKAEERGIDKAEILREMAENVPLKRLGKPEEIANITVFLCSDAAAYINGTSIPADGGLIKTV